MIYYLNWTNLFIFFINIYWVLRVWHIIFLNSLGQGRLTVGLPYYGKVFFYDPYKLSRRMPNFIVGQVKNNGYIQPCCQYKYQYLCDSQNICLNLWWLIIIWTVRNKILWLKVKLGSKQTNFDSWKCVGKCCLQNVGHFVLPTMP